MTRSESKFNHTAEKMEKALLTLLTKKSFSSITIAEICKEAGVNRSTFYSHYDNTSDLLRDSKETFIHHFLEMVKESSPKAKEASSDYGRIVSRGFLIPFLDQIRKNRVFFNVYVENFHTFNGEEDDKEFMGRIVLPALKSHGITDEVKARYIARYLLNGIYAIIMEWVGDGCKETPELIADIIMACGKPGFGFEEKK